MAPHSDPSWTTVARPSGRRHGLGPQRHSPLPVAHFPSPSLARTRPPAAHHSRLPPELLLSALVSLKDLDARQRKALSQMARAEVPRISVYSSFHVRDNDDKGRTHLLFQRCCSKGLKKPCDDIAPTHGGGVDGHDLPPQYRWVLVLGEVERERLISVIFRQLTDAQKRGVLLTAIRRETRDELLSRDTGALPQGFFDPRMEDFCGLDRSYDDHSGRRASRMYFFRCNLTEKLTQWGNVGGGQRTLGEALRLVVHDVMKRRNWREVASVGFVDLATPGLERVTWSSQLRFLQEHHGQQMAYAGRYAPRPPVAADDGFLGILRMHGAV